MSKRWMAALALCAAAAFTIPAAPAEAGGDQQNCFEVVGAANARNQFVSQRRAERRLAEKLAVHMRDPRGVTVSPTRFNCILQACEASAVVCHPYY